MKKLNINNGDYIQVYRRKEKRVLNLSKRTRTKMVNLVFPHPLRQHNLDMLLQRMR